MEQAVLVKQALQVVLEALVEQVRLGILVELVAMVLLEALVVQVKLVEQVVLVLVVLVELDKQVQQAQAVVLVELVV